MGKKKTGRCLCGAIRFSYEGEERSRLHCHCESCRRATSSPFTTWMSVRRADFDWTGMAPARYSSSPGVTRTFCPTCGSPMSYQTAERPDDIDLYAASLDDHKDFEAQRHDFWSERVAWVELADHLEKKG